MRSVFPPPYQQTLAQRAPTSQVYRRSDLAVELSTKPSEPLDWNDHDYD
jgi:hypothetical protein